MDRATATRLIILAFFLALLAWSIYQDIEINSLLAETKSVTAEIQTQQSELFRINEQMEG